MSTDRREVLKGLVAAGLLVSSTSWAKSLWQTSDGAADNQEAALTVSTLVSGSALDRAFLEGVRDALRPASATVASTQALMGLGAEDKAIWFGILVLMTVSIGLIAPPVGLNVYVVNGMAKDVSMNETYRGVMPFLASDALRLVALLCFPVLSLGLVKLFF